MHFLKKNILLIVSFIVIIFIITISTNNYLIAMKNTEMSHQNMVISCQTEEFIGTPKEEICKDTLAKKDAKVDFFTTLSEIGVVGVGGYTLILIALVIISSIYNVSKYLKNRIIVLDASRISYGKVLLKIFKEAYKSFLLLPIMVIFLFIISWIVSPNFDIINSLTTSAIPWQLKSVSNPVVFMFAYLLNVIFHAALYVNIALIMVRKNHNFFAATILSFIVFFGLEGLLEIGLYAVISLTIFHSEFGILFNAMNFLRFNDTYGISSVLLVSFSLAAVSSLIVYLSYRNKEKLIMDCEES